MEAASTFLLTILPVAASAAFAAWSAASARRLRSVKRRMQELEEGYSDLLASFDRLFASHKKLRSAEEMADRRARRAVPTESSPLPPGPRKPGESKAAMRHSLGLPDHPVELTLEAVKRARGM